MGEDADGKRGEYDLTFLALDTGWEFQQQQANPPENCPVGKYTLRYRDDQIMI